MTISHEMTTLNCWKCGCLYAVNARWFEVRICVTDGPAISCPNGHKSYYRSGKAEDSERLKSENDRLKREIAQVIHLADQAAAAHQAGQSVESHIEALQRETDTVTADGWHKCPKCEKTYKNLDRHLLRHLRNSHSMTPADAFELYKSIQAAKTTSA